LDDRLNNLHWLRMHEPRTDKQGRFGWVAFLFAPCAPHLPGGAGTPLDLQFLGTYATRATRTSAISRHFDRHFIAVEIRPNIATALAAGAANEARLDIGQPHFIGPPIGADRERMRAMKVLAIDQDAAHAGVAHGGTGDLVRAIGTRGDNTRRGASIGAPLHSSKGIIQRHYQGG
jgi:hypothetical protein